MKSDKIIAGINSTGFVLEYDVARLFEENGWSVINNRYYLDDDSQKSREIDIIAYKVKEINKTLYYTTIIISCKKNNDEAWTFLTKKLNEKDPNIDKHPIIDWSNNPEINYMKEKEGFKKAIIKGIEGNESVRFTYGIKDQVFAFQQLNEKNFKPKNDRDIYNSIITSIKALEYERSSLDKRIVSDAVYNFNIVSVFDGNMYSLKYEGKSNPIVKEIDNIKYLNRHIVNNKESFYRVHFISYNSLMQNLNYFEGLHDWHVDIYSQLKEEYQKVISLGNDESALDVHLEKFNNYVSWSLFKEKLHKSTDIVDLKFDENKDIVVHCDIKNTTYIESDELVKHFNENEKIRLIVKAALIKLYGYTGKFYFYNASWSF